MVLSKKTAVGLIALLIFPVFLSQSVAQEVCKPHRKELKEISRVFGANMNVVTATMRSENDSMARYLHPGDCVYEIIEDEKLLGYLFSTRAMGRYDYFDYCIIYSKEIAILKVIVTVYRSTHGAAICQKQWLSQFEGYRGGAIALGSNIDAVSGGTLSATSLVNDVQRCHLILSAMYPE